MSRFAPPLSPRARALTTLTTLTALGALAAAALLAAPTVASAGQPAAEAPQTTLYYSFRDLSTDQGTHALYERIVSAARTVCPGSDSRDLAEYAASRECQRQAVARAVRQIGNARLAAIYSQKLPQHG